MLTIENLLAVSHLTGCICRHNFRKVTVTFYSKNDITVMRHPQPPESAAIEIRHSD